MKGVTRAVVVSAVLLGAGALFGPAATAADDTAALKAEIEALKAQIAAVNGKLPSQAHSMIDVEYNFANLWFAGREKNWPLAAFYQNEVKNRLAWAVRIVPERTLSTGQKLDLAPMLEGIQESSLVALKKAIDTKDVAAFQAAYHQTMAECYACHEAAEKPFLKPHIPEQPEARIIAMDPNAPAP